MKANRQTENTRKLQGLITPLGAKLPRVERGGRRFARGMLCRCETFRCPVFAAHDVWLTFNVLALVRPSRKKTGELVEVPPGLVVNYAGPKIGLRNYVRITSNWT